MYNYLFQWWNYTKEDIMYAERQVEFLKNRSMDVYRNDNLTDLEKAIKIDKINLSISSIKYTYCL